jgi:hypothetical protein
MSIITRIAPSKVEYRAVSRIFLLGGGGEGEAAEGGGPENVEKLDARKMPSRKGPTRFLDVYIYLFMFIAFITSFR